MRLIWIVAVVVLGVGLLWAVPSFASPSWKATPLALPSPVLRPAVVVPRSLSLSRRCSALTTNNTPGPDGKVPSCDGTAGGYVVVGAVMSGAITAIPLLLNIIGLSMTSETYRQVVGYIGIGGFVASAVFTVASFAAFGNACDGDIPLIALSAVAAAANIALLWLSFVNIFWKPTSTAQHSWRWMPTVMADEHGIGPGLLLQGKF